MSHFLIKKKKFLEGIGKLDQLLRDAADEYDVGSANLDLAIMNNSSNKIEKIKDIINCFLKGLPKNK